MLLLPAFGVFGALMLLWLLFLGMTGALTAQGQEAVPVVQTGWPAAVVSVAAIMSPCIMAVVAYLVQRLAKRQEVIGKAAGKAADAAGKAADAVKGSDQKLDVIHGLV